MSVKKKLQNGSRTFNKPRELPISTVQAILKTNLLWLRPDTD